MSASSTTLSLGTAPCSREQGESDGSGESSRTSSPTRRRCTPTRRGRGGPTRRRSSSLPVAGIFPQSKRRAVSRADQERWDRGGLLPPPRLGGDLAVREVGPRKIVPHTWKE